MDIVNLPLLSLTTTIPEALNVLKLSQRSGLVVRDAQAVRLLHTGDLLYARAAGTHTLGDIHDLRIAIQPTSQHIERFKLDLGKPTNTGSQYEAFLSANHYRYAFLDSDQGHARIVTLSELDALGLTLTGGYQCDGSPTHYFPLPRVIVGQDCPLWPRCSRMDGSRPQVEPVP
jgi:hypothetical protein